MCCGLVQSHQKACISYAPLKKVIVFVLNIIQKSSFFILRNIQKDEMGMIGKAKNIIGTIKDIRRADPFEIRAPDVFFDCTIFQTIPP